MENMLQFFENRYKKTGDKILLSSGSGDPSVSDSTMQKILSYKCVYRWLLENFMTYEMDLNNLDPRIVPIPLGIALHPNTGQVGVELRRLIEIRKQTESHWLERKDRILFCFRGTGRSGILGQDIIALSAMFVIITVVSQIHHISMLFMKQIYGKCIWSINLFSVLSV